MLQEGMNDILALHEAIPTEWKAAHIILLPKDGAPDNPANYHPIYLNHNISGLIPVECGVWQGHTLSPLLFILAINPVLSWIDGPDTGYAFCNGVCILVASYCDKITLIGSAA